MIAIMVTHTETSNIKISKLQNLPEKCKNVELIKEVLYKI